MSELNLQKILYNSLKGNSHVGHEFVDLGLPSGRLWATCNIGAEAPTDYGVYFKWGNVNYNTISDKELKAPETYTFDDGKFVATKYNEYDNLQCLQPENDAAHVLWGGGWKIPSHIDYQELIDNCSVKIIMGQGTTGSEFTSNINGRTIFFPYCGYLSGTPGKLASGENGAFYWTCDVLNRFDCYNFFVSFEKPRVSFSSRHFSNPIRPVI